MSATTSEHTCYCGGEPWCQACNVPETVYVVTTPAGFTESFGARQIETLERLGLIEHERDGHILEDGDGNAVGPLYSFYRGARQGAHE